MIATVTDYMQRGRFMTLECVTSDHKVVLVRFKKPEFTHMLKSEGALVGKKVEVPEDRKSVRFVA